MQVNTTKQAYSVNEFCADYGISRATFYKLLRQGSGPQTYKIGDRTLISASAAAEWQSRLEAKHSRGAP